MKTMKEYGSVKILSVLSVLLLLCVLAACGADKTTLTDDPCDCSHIETVTVAFDSKGGTTVEAMKISKGSLVTEPPAPEKPYYCFTGWMYGDEEWLFNRPVTADMTLAARWEPLFAADDDGVLFVLRKDLLPAEVEVPAEIGGITVTGIYKNAFRNCSQVTSVTLPDSITSVGYGAFAGCENLTYNTYEGAAYLGSAENPYTVLVKAENAGVTFCTVHTDTRVIAPEAFRGCAELTGVTIPDGVKQIGDYAFYSCGSLVNVTMGNGVTRIGEHAFADCAHLAALTIPESVTSIGSNAFVGCGQLTGTAYDTALYLGNSSNPYRVLLKAASPDIVSCFIHADTKFIDSNAFSQCDNLTSVTIPDGVTDIGTWAFYGCGSLTSITIPASVTHLGSAAFFDCDSLTDVTLSDGITNIGGMFDECDHLTFHTYDNALYLGSAANPYMVLMKAVNTDITSCTIHADTKFIYNNAFCDCAHLTSITVPDGVKSIGRGAFKRCGALAGITLPDSVTSIDTSAFCGCGSLTNVTIPEGVMTIGKYAFAECGGLTGITFANTEGWHQAQDPHAPDGTYMNVTDAGTNAENLAGTYAWYYRYRCPRLHYLDAAA